MSVTDMAGSVDLMMMPKFSKPAQKLHQFLSLWLTAQRYGLLVTTSFPPVGSEAGLSSLTHSSSTTPLGGMGE
jgi:hypothetical protein